jgi:cysteine desulfurase family protein (TIGR01976 family)
VRIDIGHVRAGYPALRDGYAYLDGAAGTQVPETVVAAIADAYRAGIGNIGGAFPASSRSAAIVAEARQAVADLTGGVADGVVFGPSATALTYRIAAALSKSWGPGDEVVVSRLDHDSNIRPWAQAAERAGATLRWAEVDLASGELPAAQYAGLISERTRVVAVTAASNVLGTRPHVPAISAQAHAAGALCYVDGVHATPHVPVDVAALGADFYTTSAYTWSGPHVAAVVAAPSLLESLHPDKLAPSPDSVPDRFERGTLPLADLAGVAAAVSHLASLSAAPITAPRQAGPGDPAGAAGGSRRERLLASMAAVEEYEAALFASMLDGLASMSHITLYGSVPKDSAPAAPKDAEARRAPTAFFTVAGLAPRAVAESLAARGVNVWSGNNYALELCCALGLGPDGAVRAGLVHYNDETDVDRLLACLDDLG